METLIFLVAADLSSANYSLLVAANEEVIAIYKVTAATGDLVGMLNYELLSLVAEIPLSCVISTPESVVLFLWYEHFIPLSSDAYIIAVL